MRNIGLLEMILVPACCLVLPLIIVAVVIVLVVWSSKKKAEATPAPDTASEPAALSPEKEFLIKVGEDEMGAPIQPAPEPIDLDEMGTEVQSEPADEPDEV